MIISGFQKLTLVDYPGNTACIIFTQGCNFRCPFCHNSSLLTNENNSNTIDIKTVFDYLDKRKGMIDGVCISGGEPLLHEDLEEFIKEIKEKGYKVKLDTNGSKPKLLEKLLENNLIDYVAMDIKNSFDKYNLTAGVTIDIESIKKSVELLKSSNIDYEFRTTISKELHSLDDIKKIVQYLGPKVKYYLQNYRECETVLKKGLNSFSEEELTNIENALNKEYPNIFIRGRGKR